MKRALVLGVLLPAMLAATTSMADGKAACLDAASKGQRLKATHKLVEAREQLRICAAAECPAVVQSDCANWLGEVERTLPSVVVTAKDAAGVDLADVTVTVDGQPFVSSLDGQAKPMNAGSHTFHFERAGSASVDRPVIVREGEKNQSVSVILSAAAAAATAPAPLGPAPAAPEKAGGSSDTLRTAGWILGGAGVVGLAVGTVFGFTAISDKNSAQCTAANQCLAGPLSSTKSAALASDIGFIAGGVLFASGAAILLWAPKAGDSTEKSAGTGVKIAPMVGAGRGGAVVEGSW
jgi:hypothetical protein